MEILRFITCGSVDDGKSTLIGRMLYDSQAVQVDLLEAIQESSRRNGSGQLDLSLLTDGLKAEREQRITIDVAYKYFNTAKRKYIIADTPGHVQYTRNMVTGASTAQLAILLVDARKGVIEQTRRHAYIAALLGLPHIVLAINKMDLVDYSQECYDRIRQDFLNFMHGLPFEMGDIAAIPVSALEGDNIVHPSQKMPWYTGQPMLSHLDSVELEYDENLKEQRFPVQSVIRPQSAEFRDYRAYSGQVAGGILRPGDVLKVFPGGQQSRIVRIEFAGKELAEAFPPMSVSLLLEDDLDISRGDLLVGRGQEPLFSQECTAEICWMETERLEPKSKYILKHTSRQVNAIVSEIVYRLDIHSLHARGGQAATHLELNDLGRIRLKTQQALYFDPYIKNRHTGSLILIDPGSFATVGAAMLVS